MKYLSVCSGIEAASVAWHGLGFEPVGFSEIEPFPSAVLAHRFPHVKNFEDMTKFKEWNLGQSIDILVGGTPCQSFSVAGLRKGLDDPRGNLMLTFGAIANHFKPRFIIWENVPGVLSSNGGRDFGTFLGMLEECGYGFAYRILDAQHFGVPQRRRRVFVVGCLRDWISPAKILFESESLRWNIEKVSGGIIRGRNKSITGCLSCRVGGYDRQDLDIILFEHGPRNIIPKEAERLQGFPDNWTRIPWRGRPAEDCPDGPRYKACGNSMAVPVMRWIGERIKMFCN
jgi:DNA (cytosine-5)-methyltransferase 1